jgi:hypothetical protein
MRTKDSTRSCALAAPQRRLASPRRRTSAGRESSPVRADRGLLERRRRSLRRARRNPGSPSTKRGPAGRRSLFPRLRRHPAADRVTANGPCEASEGSTTMSSLGYGLGSWGLLNVVFLLSMFYPARDTAAKRRYEHPRAAWRGLFDRNARTGQPLRAHQRRPRTDCDRPARSAHALPRRSRTGRRSGIAGACRSACSTPRKPPGAAPTASRQTPELLHLRARPEMKGKEPG